jgi:hypothetical protein
MPLMRRLTVLAGAVEAARRYAKNNPEKINKLADKAGRFVDKRTKGKYHKQIDGAVRKVRSSTSHSGSRGSWPHR